MAHLSTRHDNKQSGILNNELVASMISREVPTDVQIHNHNIHHIGNLSDHPGLRKIDIAFNPIDDLRGIDQCPQLRHLCVYGGGKLCDLRGIEGTKKLEVLLIQRNAITQLGLSFHPLTKLRELRVDKNFITALGSDLSTCTSLRRLDLSHNQLTSLEGLAGLQSLEELRVANNNITSFKHLRALPSLEEIDISYNKLKTLDGLEFVPTLSTLRAEHNHISTLKIPKIYGIDKSNPSLGGGGSGGIASSMSKLTQILTGGNSNSITSSSAASKVKSSKSTGALGNATNDNVNKSSKDKDKIPAHSHPVNPHSTTVGLVLLTDVYLTGNRLTSFAGIETLCPNVKYLDARSNKITIQAMLANPDGTIGKDGDGDYYNVEHIVASSAAAAAAAAAIAVPVKTATTAPAPTAASGPNSITMLTELKKLCELLLDMNPVTEDPQAMISITSALRITNKNLHAVDGLSFLSQVQMQQSKEMGTVLLNPLNGNKENDKNSNDKDDDIKGPFITGANSGGMMSVSGGGGGDDASVVESVARWSDEEEDDETPEDAKMRKSRELRAARDPNSSLRPKIVPKVVTMEKIQEAEESIRHVITDSRSILKSILLLDDTEDGLFASVARTDLPESEQMQKILAISLPPPPSPSKPAELIPAILSPRTAMKRAVQVARERNARVALALGQAAPEGEEEEEDMEGENMIGLGKPGYHRRTVVDADDQVHIAHNVTVYTTQGNVMFENAAGDDSGGTLSMRIAPAADVKGSTKAGVAGDEEDDLAIAQLDPRSPLFVKPKATNKDKVKNLVKSIRDSVEAEFAALSPQEKKDREKSRLTGGTVGVTTRPTHEADLPVGSGLTRYGSKIKHSDRKISSKRGGAGIDPYASTTSIASGTADGDDDEDDEDNDGASATTGVTSTSATTYIQHSPITKGDKKGQEQEQEPHQIANNPNKYSLSHLLAIEAEKKLLDTEKAVWSYSHAGNPNPAATPSRLGLDFSDLHSNDGPLIYTSPVINYDDRTTEVADTALQAIANDRRKMQEEIDRRLGFSLTDPKSPIPGFRSKSDPSVASAGIMNEGYEFSEISPRTGAFDKFQITAARPGSSSNQGDALNSSGSGSARGSINDIFSQTFDPRFHKNVGPGMPSVKSHDRQDLEFSRQFYDYNAGGGGDGEDEEEGEEAEEMFLNSTLLSGHASIENSNTEVTNIGHSPIMNDDGDDNNDDDGDTALAFKRHRKQQNMDDDLSDDEPSGMQASQSRGRKRNNIAIGLQAVMPPSNIVVNAIARHAANIDAAVSGSSSLPDKEFVMREMAEHRVERNITSASNAAIRAAINAASSASSTQAAHLHTSLQRPIDAGAGGTGSSTTGPGPGAGMNKGLVRPGVQQPAAVPVLSSTHSLPKFRTPNMRSGASVASTSCTGTSSAAASEPDLAALELESKVLSASHSASSINVLQLSPRGR